MEKKWLIASSFLLNVYSTCEHFVINRYTVTALILIWKHLQTFYQKYTLVGTPKQNIPKQNV